MKISFEIPEAIAERLEGAEIDVSREARALFLLELFRRRLIAHGQLGDALGLRFHEADDFLRSRGIAWGAATIEEQGIRNGPLAELLRQWGEGGEDAEAEQLETMQHLRKALPDDFT